MPELDAALAEIRRLADRPPVHPPPVSAVANRMRRRRRHRRMAVVVGSAASLVIIALAIVAATQTRPGAQRVRTSGSHTNPLPKARSTTTPSTIIRPSGVPPTAPADGHGMTVTPAVGLVDRSSVRLSADPPPSREVVARGQVIIAQCTAEALRYLGTGDQSAILNWCTLDTTGAPPTLKQPFVIRRVLRTGTGIVDCAAKPRRCVIAVRLGGLGSTDDRFAPLTFRPDLAPRPVPRARLVGVNGPIVDGQRVTVSGEGFRPRALVEIVECIGSPENVDDAVSCDATRYRSLRSDTAGQFRTDVFVFRDIQLQRGEKLPPWRRCDPCTLRVGAVDILLDIADGAAPVHPEVQIVEPGPYRTDQRVTLQGGGFQIDQKVQVYWCRLDNPLQDCATSREALFALKADAAGRLTVPSFPMPPRRFGAYGSTCIGPAARCGLAWHPAEGVPAAFVTPFQMVP